MAGDRMFWAYANLVFEGLVVFILPLAFAVRELWLLRRERRRPPAPEGSPAGPPPWHRRRPPRP